MVISTKLPKEMVVSLIWSFCFNRVLGKVPLEIVSVTTKRVSVTAATSMEMAMKASNSDEGDGDGNNGGG